MTQSSKSFLEYDLHASLHLRAGCLGLGEDSVPVREVDNGATLRHDGFDAP